jgi:hypothetical protein
MRKDTLRTTTELRDLKVNCIARLSPHFDTIQDHNIQGKPVTVHLNAKSGKRFERIIGCSTYARYVVEQACRPVMLEVIELVSWCAFKHSNLMPLPRGYAFLLSCNKDAFSIKAIDTKIHSIACWEDPATTQGQQASSDFAFAWSKSISLLGTLLGLVGLVEEEVGG